MPTRGLRNLLVAIVLSALGSRALEAQEIAGCQLAITSASVRAGSPAELSVQLQSPSASVAAVSFVIRYDTARLMLEPSDTTRSSALDVTIPPQFVASTFEDPEKGEIGISIYDPVTPIDTLPSGTLLKIRFQTRQATSGFAAVRVATNPAPDAADANAQQVPVTVTAIQTGVNIESSIPALSASPRELEFGSVDVNETSEKQIVLTNIGSGSASIAGVELVAGNDSFSIAESAAQFPIALGNERSFAVTIRYGPRQAGRHESQLHIRAAGEARTIVIPISGSAVTDGSVEFPLKLLIPTVARVPGANNSNWRSSLVAYNSGDIPAFVRLTLHRPGGDGPLSRTIEVKSRESRRWNDLVGELFGDLVAAGSMTLDLSSSDVVIESATSNILESGGRIGQSVPVVPWTEVFRTGRIARLVGLSRSSESRTNLALMNLGRTATLLRASVRDGSGAVLGERDYVLEPDTIVHGIDLFDALSIQSSENLSVEIRCLTDDGTFFAYASTIDRKTGAPLFQAAQ